jgi:hypothetical protein
MFFSLSGAYSTDFWPRVKYADLDSYEHEHQQYLAFRCIAHRVLDFRSHSHIHNYYGSKSPVRRGLLTPFFLKPNLKFSVLPTIRTVANVTILEGVDKFDKLGSRNVSFILLKIKNDGNIDASDCMCAVSPTSFGTIQPHDYVIPVELHLAYVPTTSLSNVEIFFGQQMQGVEIGMRDRNFLTASTKTIHAHGSEGILLLAFLIEGIPSLFLGVANGAAKLDMVPVTLNLRASTDGKLHQVMIEPRSWSNVSATLLH